MIQKKILGRCLQRSWRTYFGTVILIERGNRPQKKNICPIKKKGDKTLKRKQGRYIWIRSESVNQKKMCEDVCKDFDEGI